MNVIPVCLLLIVIQINCTYSINNRVRSPIPPLNMAVNDIPMFLTITFDDALHEPAHEHTLLILNHTNRNNEQIPLVYYVSNEFSDYSLIQQRYLQGCEFAVHTVTHTTNVHSDIVTWYHEITKSRQLMSIHADIPINEIVGFRAPFLQMSDISFQVLSGVRPKFSYDSTIISKLDANDLFDWPYTLDDFEPDYPYNVGEGPKQSYPGFWEMPMYSLYSDIANKQHFGSMDYIGDYNVILNAFKSNFMHRMTTNKSPMGLYFHSSWLYDNAHVDAMNDFIQWVLDMDNTWVATNKQVINWMNNPVTNAQYNLVSNNQLMNNQTEFISCLYEGIFRTVQSACPPELPHNIRDHISELVHSQITITSNNDNLLTTPHMMCTNDTYIDYNINTVYCANARNKQVVMYNNALHQCKWWTRGKIPSASDEWLLVKKCVQHITTFAQSSIAPYGNVTVFADTALDIIVLPYDGYEIDAITVRVMNENNYYNLSIFEDYELITGMNGKTTNAQLTIRFIEIKSAAYQIEFSFKNTTLPPTRMPTISTNNPTVYPSYMPTIASISPSYQPTQPSKTPTKIPTNAPILPSVYPTIQPSNSPIASMNPTVYPTVYPTVNVLSGTPISLDFDHDNDNDKSESSVGGKLVIVLDYATLVIVLALLVLLIVIFLLVVRWRTNRQMAKFKQDMILHFGTSLSAEKSPSINPPQNTKEYRSIV